MLLEKRGSAFGRNLLEFLAFKNFKEQPFLSADIFVEKLFILLYK